MRTYDIAAAGIARSDARAQLERLAAQEPRFGRDARRRRLLAAADATALVAAALVLLATRQGADPALAFVAFSPMWIVLAKALGLYDRDHRVLRWLTVDELPSLILWALAGTAIMTTTLIPLQSLEPNGVARLEMWVSVVGAAFLARAAARAIWRRTTPPERVIVIGSGPLAEATLRKLQVFPEIHCRVVATIEDGEEILAAVEAASDIDRVLVAADPLTADVATALLPICRKRGVKLTIIPPGRNLFGTDVTLTHVADLPMLEYNTSSVSRSSLLIKRVADVVLGSLLLLVTAPLFLMAALLIIIDSGFPVFFKQTRAGRHAHPFRMVKFRTMSRDAEELLQQLVPFEELEVPMFKLRDDPRVTRIGRLLRRTSVDELPQLWNVLLGDMSLVGPRPEQLDLVDLYQQEDRFRLAVKPGVTGPMQVYGRGELRFEERLAVERDYIENLTFRRDLRILCLTIPAVISGRGAF